MREPRNPFRLLAAEHIESDLTFLRFFGPGVLDIFSETDLSSSLVKIFRSAPGGGKTSLFRLFTPKVLKNLCDYRTNNEYRELYNKMKTLGVVDEFGPQVLGIHLSCSKGFSAISDVGLSNAVQRKLLFNLLDARLLLAAMRNIAVFADLDTADLMSLERITISPSRVIEGSIKFPCTGKQLVEWARHVEREVCSKIDSFNPSLDFEYISFGSFACLSLLEPDAVQLDGKRLTRNVLLMLDDVHKLTQEQRSEVLQKTIESRSSTTVWFAERFEALRPQELLSHGALYGRDYGGVIQLEEYWSQRSGQFEKLVLNIADRRARTARDEIGEFASYTAANLDGSEWLETFEKAIRVVSDRVKRIASSESRYQEWIASRESIKGTRRQVATEWKVLEILMERDRRKKQKYFDFPLNTEELEGKESSSVRVAAELFLAREFSLPYYFGPSVLATLASSNIEQFLWLAGEEFEELVASLLVSGPSNLPAKRQESIIMETVKKRWTTIPQNVPRGNEVKRLLESIGRFSNSVTYEPNAPYSPGVTGVAISIADKEHLANMAEKEPNSEHGNLARLLGICLANNLLELRDERRAKGQLWSIFYLNRYLCPLFQLPIHYGGWRNKNLGELIKWTKGQYSPPVSLDVF